MLRVVRGVLAAFRATRDWDRLGRQMPGPATVRAIRRRLCPGWALRRTRTNGRLRLAPPSSNLAARVSSPASCLPRVRHAAAHTKSPAHGEAAGRGSLPYSTGGHRFRAWRTSSAKLDSTEPYALFIETICSSSSMERPPCLTESSTRFSNVP